MKNVMDNLTNKIKIKNPFLKENLNEKVPL